MQKLISWPRLGCLYTAIPFGLGTGLVYVTAIALLGLLPSVAFRRSSRFAWPQAGSCSIIFFTFVFVYVFLYISQSRVELLPPGFYLSKYFFVKVAVSTIYIALCPIVLSSLSMCLVFCLSLAVGAYARSVSTVFASFFYLEPPFHGKVFDLATWNFGNSPSFANMLIVSVAFFASVLANKKLFRLNARRQIVFFALMLTAIFSGVFLQARLFSIVVFGFVPFFYFINIFFCHEKAKDLICSLGFSVCLFSVGLIINNSDFFSREGRAVDQSLGADLRFELYSSFIKQILIDPFAYAAVPNNIVETIGIVQFHNFFADIDRISGPWAFLMAIILIAYIFLLILRLFIIRSPYAPFIAFNFFSGLMVLNTSVEPEGGGQAYLMVLCMGAIAARVLDLHLKESR